VTHALGLSIKAVELRARGRGKLIQHGGLLR
jgi:hypothetical protein